MAQRRCRSGLMLRPVRHPAAILAPRHLGGIEAEILAADVVVLADLGATQAREEALYLIGARAVLAIRNRVVDPAHLEPGVQRIPAGRLIGMDRAARQDVRTDQGDAIGLLGDRPRQGPAVPLTGHDDGLALGRDAQAAILAVCLDVLWLGVASEIGAVHLDHAGQRATAHLLSGDRLAELVSQDEGSFVLHVEVAAELQGRDALDRVHENRDSGEIVADRELAAGEDGAAGDAELLLARLALPDAPGRIGIDRRAAAVRAERRTPVVGKADRHKRRVRLIVAQPKHGRERERPCFC